MRTSRQIHQILFHNRRYYLVPFLVLILSVGLYQYVKSLPDGVSLYGSKQAVPADEVSFLHDLTYETASGNIEIEQEIFDTVFSLIAGARKYILIDMFLFNPHMGKAAEPYRKLSGELTTLLIQKKQSNPSIHIDIITDPINNAYGGAPSEQITALRKAGVNVVVTDLTKLRDSNPLYSTIWRVFFQWFGNSPNGGLFKHPFSDTAPTVTLRSYLSLLNFKANHRKVIIADSGGDMVTCVLSANCHDASSAHSNVGISVTGDYWREIYQSEKAIAAWSGKQLHAPDIPASNCGISENTPELHIQWLSEKAVKDRLLTLLHETGNGDSLSMAMFYLSDRDIIRSLLRAEKKGAGIRIILDPAKDAFGYEKNGIPNRQAAGELIRKSHGGIEVRWYNTHGEQFHSKLTYIRKKDGISYLMTGSANLTRRNLCNFNLECDGLVRGDSSTGCMENVNAYFNRIWENKEGNKYTLDYSLYEDTSRINVLKYFIYEYAGLSTF